MTAPAHFAVFDTSTGALVMTGFGYEGEAVTGQDVLHEIGDQALQYVTNPTSSPALATRGATSTSIDKTTVEPTPGPGSKTDATVTGVVNPSDYRISWPGGTVATGTVTDGELVFSSADNGVFTIGIDTVTEVFTQYTVTVTA